MISTNYEEGTFEKLRLVCKLKPGAWFKLNPSGVLKPEKYFVCRSPYCRVLFFQVYCVNSVKAPAVIKERRLKTQGFSGSSNFTQLAHTEQSKLHYKMKRAVVTILAKTVSDTCLCCRLFTWKLRDLQSEQQPWKCFSPAPSEHGLCL